MATLRQPLGCTGGELCTAVHSGVDLLGSFPTQHQDFVAVGRWLVLMILNDSVVLRMLGESVVPVPHPGESIAEAELGISASPGSLKQGCSAQKQVLVWGELVERGDLHQTK